MVSFTTDRDTRDWMMGYYLNNADFDSPLLARGCTGPISDAMPSPSFNVLHPHGIVNMHFLPTESGTSSRTCCTTCDLSWRPISITHTR